MSERTKKSKEAISEPSGKKSAEKQITSLDKEIHQQRETESQFISVRGAQQHNLRNIDVLIPRNSFVVFTGVSGSGKSSLAFGTIYAEAQRRYFESIAPYARRLLEQLPAPRVTEISGLPPAVALQQRRGEPTVRSTVGTLTTLSNSLRMLFSRAGTYPSHITEKVDSDIFSANTPAGACPACHGVGLVHDVTEQSLVPDPNLSIRQQAVAAWPGAWQGKNYRDILAVLGYDIDKPWKDLAQKDRDWILFTEEKPVVTVYAEREAHRIQRPYQGTYMSAASYVRHTFTTTGSATLRKRVTQFMESRACPECKGKRLKKDALSIKFAGYDIADLQEMPLASLAQVLRSATELSSGSTPWSSDTHEIAEMIVNDLLERIQLLTDLGLDYLAMNRTTPTLSAGELQRLRLTTQLRSGLFGVVYVLDEPSAGLHPADSLALMKMLQNLKEGGNSLILVEHEMELVRKADWIIDIGPGAGEQGGKLLYSGLPDGLRAVADSKTREYLFPEKGKRKYRTRSPKAFLKLHGVKRHNLNELDVEFPLGVFTAVTGVSGAGKSSLVSHVLYDSVASQLGLVEEDDETSAHANEGFQPDDTASSTVRKIDGMDTIKRLVRVDQRPIGRTPRSNLATYTGFFDNIRQKFASTDEAKKRSYNAGRFSFNVAGGRCATCEGEGFVAVELLFLPSVYTRCSSCHGTRYNEQTLEIKYRGVTIAEVLEMTVDKAAEFFVEIAAVARALKTLQDVGLGYLRLGQPATELSGGEAQRIKLATELQRVQKGNTLYILDEPTTGLHPADVELLLSQLHELVEAGNTVIVVEHDMDVISNADWILDMGPGPGADGGRIVACGPPATIIKSRDSRTAPFLKDKFVFN